MKKQTRNGFTMVELTLVIMIFSVIAIAIAKQMQSTNRTAQIQKELDYRATVDTGMKKVFEQIIDSFEPICSNINSDTQTLWGWGHAQCSGTSPFPQYVAPEHLRYTINLTSLSATNRQSLINNIVAAFSPYCVLDTTNNTQVNLLCADMSNLTYDLGAGNVAAAHTVGIDIDPFNAPTATLSLRRREGDGTVSTQTNNISFLDVYQKRRSFSLEKFNVLRDTMKTFYNNQLTVEVANAPSTGLNSVNDEFVPWQWKIFGDDTAQVLGSVCNLGGGTTCANLNSDNIWRSSLSGIGLFMRRVSSNLLNGDTRMAVDGFGNQLILYPMLSQCANNDISTCGTVAPAIPQNDYFNVMRPPYMSVVYINTYKNKTVNAPAYGRKYIAY